MWFDGIANANQPPHTGKDGTAGFEDVGHSSDAIAIRETYLIGHLSSEPAPQVCVTQHNNYTVQIVKIVFHLFSSGKDGCESVCSTFEREDSSIQLHSRFWDREMGNE